MALVKPACREKVVTFGPAGGLVGIVSTPADPQPSLPGVILINSGIIHRVGANRLYVTCARHLAGAGITALRFDLSGIGDSERSSGVVALAQSVRADLTAAVDLLCAQPGVSRVVLMGLCSGAFDSFDYALRDPRVVGAAMLDMPGPFRNWGHLMHFLAERVARPSAWKSPARKLLGLGAAAATLVRPESEPLADASAAPALGMRGGRSRDRMELELDALGARGVQLCFIFTAGADKSYNHISQFKHLFPRAVGHTNVQIDLLPWCDHIFSTRESRTYLTTRLRNWIVERMPAEI